jgi:hypothetical protein
LAGLDSREDDGLAEIELIYSILDEINQARSAFGRPAVHNPGTIDPTVTNLDLNADTETDAFLSFRVRLVGVAGEPGLQDALSTLAGINITSTTPLSYVIATSTQNNSLNQDLGGVSGGINSSLTWTQLGGLSHLVSIDGTNTDTPEPGTASFFVIGGVAIAAGRKWRRRRNSVGTLRRHPEIAARD